MYTGHLSGVLIADQYKVAREFYSQVQFPAASDAVQEGAEVYVEVNKNVAGLGVGKTADVVGSVVSSGAKNLLENATEVPKVFKDFCDKVN